MSFISGHKEKEPRKLSQETADIPPSLSDLHCFTETEGVITTSSWNPPSLVLLLGPWAPPSLLSHQCPR